MIKPKGLTVKLALKYIAVDDNNPARGASHSDGFTLSRLFGMFRFHRTSKAEKVAATRLRVKGLEAHKLCADSIEIDDDQETLLRKVVEAPHEHLHDDGHPATGLEAVLNEPVVAAGLLQLGMVLSGDEGDLYDDDEGIKQLNALAGLSAQNEDKPTAADTV